MTFPWIFYSPEEGWGNFSPEVEEEEEEGEMGRSISKCRLVVVQPEVPRD